MPDDLAKLSNVVKNDAVKKVDFSPLKTKVDNIDTSNFVLKSKFENDVKDLDDKIDKVNKKIPDITNLATESRILHYYLQLLLMVKLQKLRIK